MAKPITDTAAVAFIANPSGGYSRRGIKMNDVPADKVFPHGQKMHKGAWGIVDGQFQSFANNGFTIAGPIDGTENPNRITEAHNAGMMTDILLRNIGVYVAGCPTNAFAQIVCQFKNNPAGVRAAIRNRINVHLAIENGIGEQVIQNWWDFAEETQAHTDRLPVGIAMGEEVRATDNKYGGRILCISQNPNSCYHDCRRNMGSSNVPFGNFSPQAPWGSASYSKNQKSRRWYYQVGLEMTHLCAHQGNSDWGRMYANILTFRDVSNDDGATGDLGAYYKKTRKHDVIAALMGGLDGYNFYKYGGLTYSHRTENRAGMSAATKMITDTGMDKVFLWGKITGGSDAVNNRNISHTVGMTWTGDRTVRTVRQRSSVPNAGTFCHPGGGYCEGNPDGKNCSGYTNNYLAKSIIHKTYQFKGMHYVVGLNSHRTETMQVTFTGLPATNQLVIKDLVTGQIRSITSGRITVPVSAESAVLLRVQPAAGYIGDPETEADPIVTAASPSSLTIALGADAEFTSSAIGATEQHWQYLPANTSVWKNFDTAVITDKLTLTNVQENYKDNRFRLWVKNSVATVTGASAILHVTIPPSLVISKVKVGGVWKNMQNAYVKIGGVWKQITDVKLKVNGTWRTSSFGSHLVAPGITTQPRLNASYVEGTATPTLSIVATPAGATHQWQWRNPTASTPKPTFSNISGKTAKTYKILDRGAGLTMAQNDDRFRCVVKHDGTTLNSSEVVLKVTAKPMVELVKNGNFSSGLANWEAKQGSGTLSVISGQLKAMNTATQIRVGAYQDVPVKAGHTYTVKVTLIDTRTANMAFKMGTSAGKDDLGQIWTSTKGVHTRIVTMLSNNFSIAIRVGTTEAGRYIVVDNVSVIEVT